MDLELSEAETTICIAEISSRLELTLDMSCAMLGSTSLTGLLLARTAISAASRGHAHMIRHSGQAASPVTAAAAKLDCSQAQLHITATCCGSFHCVCPV
jgi:hypothetical protein